MFFEPITMSGNVARKSTVYFEENIQFYEFLSLHTVQRTEYSQFPGIWHARHFGSLLAGSGQTVYYSSLCINSGSFLSRVTRDSARLGVERAKSRRLHHSDSITATVSPWRDHGGSIMEAQSRRLNHGGSITSARSRRLDHCGLIMAA